MASVSNNEEEEADRQEPAARSVWIPDDDAPVTLEEVKAYDVLGMAKDRVLSRVLQRSFLKGGPEVSTLISQRAVPHFDELVRDQFGNYLAQKVLEVCGEELFDQLLSSVMQRAEELALDPHGVRVLQKLVEQGAARGKTDELTAMLRPELCRELACSGAGYHIVTKLVERMPMKEAGELAEFLCGKPEDAVALAKDQWGCCVLKKCIDRHVCCRDQIIEAVVRNAPALAQDAFGNYAVQHVILLGCPSNKTYEHVPSVIDALEGQIFQLAQQKFSSPVVEKCLACSTGRDRGRIIKEILNPSCCQPSEAVRTLLHHHYGNYVLQQALERAHEPQFSLLIELAKPHVHEAAASGGPAEGDAAKEKEALATEHVRRLCWRLIKKYPALAEGLDWEAAGWEPYYDAYSVPYGMGGGPWPPAFPTWDPNWLQCIAGLAMEGGPLAAQGGARERSASSRRARSRGRAPSAEGGAEEPTPPEQTVKVGRVIGFWPNYVTVYDDDEGCAAAASWEAAVAEATAAKERRKKRGRAGGAQRKARAERRKHGQGPWWYEGQPPADADASNDDAPAPGAAPGDEPADGREGMPS